MTLMSLKCDYTISLSLGITFIQSNNTHTHTHTRPLLLFNRAVAVNNSTTIPTVSTAASTSIIYYY